MLAKPEAANRTPHKQGPRRAVSLSQTDMSKPISEEELEGFLDVLRRVVRSETSLPSNIVEPTGPDKATVALYDGGFDPNVLVPTWADVYIPRGINETVDPSRLADFQEFLE